LGYIYDVFLLGQTINKYSLIGSALILLSAVLMFYKNWVLKREVSANKALKEGF
jgi:drug/metabolite transporter (DMT)-like permease